MLAVMAPKRSLYLHQIVGGGYHNCSPSLALSGESSGLQSDAPNTDRWVNVPGAGNIRMDDNDSLIEVGVASALHIPGADGAASAVSEDSRGSGTPGAASAVSSYPERPEKACQEVLPRRFLL